MKKLKFGVMSTAAALALAGLVSCGSTSKSLTVCVGPNPDTIDPALNSAVDGATMIIHAFSGITKFVQDGDSTKIVPDVADDAFDYTSDYTTAADGKVTYKIPLKKDLKWSDGTSYDANAFVYSWNRAASGKLAADYGYMFDVIDGYEECSADTTGAAKLNVSASEDGNTLTVVLNNYVPYFGELLAFPTYMPVKESVVEANGESWATDASTYIGNGPMKMVSWTADSSIVMEKNENYYGKDDVTCEKITFALSDDDASQLANFQKGDWQFIDSVPNDQMKTLAADDPDEYFVVGQLGTYYCCFNINDDTFSTIANTEKKRENVRKALTIMLDRQYIVDEIGQAGQTPANSFVATGLTDPAGGEFTDHNGVNGDGSGYFDASEDAVTANQKDAVELIKGAGFTYDDATGKFTNFPKISYITNKGTGHVLIAQYIQGVFDKFGISMDVSQQEWADFLQTRKDGNYSMARNGWLGDYNDPISFLDMWTTGSGNNDIQLGKDEHKTYAAYSVDLNNDGSIGSDETGLTWAESYDVLIGKIKASTVPTERFKMMHNAETLLMSTWTVCPIYNYTDVYMKSSKVKGFYSTPTGFKYFMHTTITE
ncbi:MAG: peptide ABC transporter substrate-binding protein [Bacilli bacterium]